LPFLKHSYEKFQIKSVDITAKLDQAAPPPSPLPINTRSRILQTVRSKVGALLAAVELWYTLLQVTSPLNYWSWQSISRFSDN
jgi:hypothetical protein